MPKMTARLCVAIYDTLTKLRRVAGRLPTTHDLRYAPVTDTVLLDLPPAGLYAYIKRILTNTNFWRAAGPEAQPYRNCLNDLRRECLGKGLLRRP